MTNNRVIVAATAVPGVRSSGVVNAVEPFLVEVGGVWIGHAIGTIQPRREFEVRTVSMSDEEATRFYDGASHSGLWPLCHPSDISPAFRFEDFEAYRAINARFADAISEAAQDDKPVVLVQNYHLALVPHLVRQRLPQSRIATFWHIAWPEPRTFDDCPWHLEILDGLLGSDVLGFQTPLDCFNFLEGMDSVPDVRIDRDEGILSYDERRILVRDYPASVAWPGQWAKAGSVGHCRMRVRRDLRLRDDVLLGIGVDRLDVTKGIAEKFLALERLFECHPEFSGRFVFVQLLQPGHDRLPGYHSERRRILDTAQRVNARFTQPNYQPILVFEAHHAAETIARHFRAADVCVVGSLRDGMNLESKEFIAARDDEQGVLVLSECAGATCELAEALIVDPDDVDGVSAAIAHALRMHADEQRQRMRRLRDAVQRNDACAWGRRLVNDLTATREAKNPKSPETPPSLSKLAQAH